MTQKRKLTHHKGFSHRKGVSPGARAAVNRLVAQGAQYAYRRASQYAAKKIQGAWKSYKARRGARGALRTVTQSNPQSSVHNDMSRMKLRVFLGRAKPSFKKFSRVAYVNHCRYAGLLSSEGTQLHTSPIDILNTTQFLSNTPASDGLSSFPTGLFNMNPMLKVTGDGAASAGISAGTTPLQRKIHVRSISGHMELINFQNTSTEISFYVLRCHRSTNENPNSAWSTAASGDKEGIATGGLSGYTNNSASEGGPNPDFYGEYPFKYKEFKRFWTVVGVRKFVLEPGEVKKIDISIAVNHTWDYRTMFTQPAAYIPGHLSTLLIARPQIVGLAPPGSNPGDENNIGDVSYGKGHIGFVSRMQYNVVFPTTNESMPVSRIFCNVPQTSGAGAAVEKIINVVDGLAKVISG